MPFFSAGINFNLMAANTASRFKPSFKVERKPTFVILPLFEKVNRILILPASLFFRAASVYEGKGLKITTTGSELLSFSGVG